MRRTPLLAALAVAAALGIADGDAARTVEPRVGYVAYAGDVPNPHSLSGLPLLGFVRAQRELPITGRVRYVGPTQGPGAVLTTFGREGYDLVVAPLFDSRPLDSLAKRFPHTHFVVVDAQPGISPKLRVRNIHRLVFRAEQSAYLAGYLSALMARRAGGNEISAVAGFPYYGVDRWIVGFRAGAKKAVPGLTVRVDYSHDFANPRKCRRVALSQIASGSKVIYDVAGSCGVGALEAARQRHVWGVGVDVDQSNLGPHILTSSVMRLDRAVFEAVRRRVHRGLKPGGTIVFGLANDGVELGHVSPKVPRALLRQVAAIRRQIVSGAIVVPRPGP